VTNDRGERGPRGEQGERGLPGEDANGENHVTIDELVRAKHRAHMRLFISFVVMIVLFACLAFYQEKQTREIDNNAKKIEEVQMRTSDEVLCPLYALLVNILQHPLPGRVDTPEERKANGDALSVILQGYNALDCPAPKEQTQTGGNNNE
jgi:hypothetical protein